MGNQPRQAQQSDRLLASEGLWLPLHIPGKGVLGWVLLE